MQDPYMAITGHYIDDNWVLHSTLLDFVYIPGSHTGFRIYEMFVDPICVKYDLSKKIMGITLDNAANNDVFYQAHDIW